MEVQSKKYPLTPPSVINTRKNKNFIPFLNSSAKFFNCRKNY